MAVEVVEKKKNVKTVHVTALPNVAPAGTVIYRKGSGSNWQIAAGRALEAIAKDARLRGKSKIWPIKLTIDLDVE